MVLYYIASIWAWENVPSDMCAQRRLRSACAFAQSDLSLRCSHEEILNPWIQDASSEDSEQTARMRRQIWIFAWRSCPKACFLTMQPSFVMCLCLTLHVLSYPTKTSHWLDLANNTFNFTAKAVKSGHSKSDNYDFYQQGRLRSNCAFGSSQFALLIRCDL